jgi:FkbM family methyltransferase
VLILLNQINHAIARKNALINPQLIIFAFDHIGLSINLEGRYENSSLAIMEKFLYSNFPNSKSETVLDIGANIGNHSIFFAKFFNRVYSFEPNPITYEVLRMNAKYTPTDGDIIPLNFGLSDKEGDLPFLVSNTNMGGSRILLESSDITGAGAIFVPVRVADQIDEINNENVSLIKIDVEGHEINALRGAEKILLSKKPSILFEQGVAEIQNGSSLVIEYLSSLGYKFYTIQKNFYFGELFIQRLLGFVFRLFLGEKVILKETKTFKKRFYDMILAVHN